MSKAKKKIEPRPKSSFGRKAGAAVEEKKKEVEEIPIAREPMQLNESNFQMSEEEKKESEEEVEKKLEPSE